MFQSIPNISMSNMTTPKTPMLRGPSGMLSEEAEARLSQIIANDNDDADLGEVIRYVEVPVVEEVIRHVTKKEIVEVEKRVPKIETVVVERTVEVPEIHVVESVVEVPKSVEVIKHVAKKEIIEVEKEVIRYEKVIKTNVIEKIIEIDGELISVPKPYIVENEVIVSNYKDTEVPFVVLEKMQPSVFEAPDDDIEVTLKEYDPYIVPVDIYIPKPVVRTIQPKKQAEATYVGFSTSVEPELFNRMLECLNPETESKELPFRTREDGSYTVGDLTVPPNWQFLSQNVILPPIGARKPSIVSATYNKSQRMSMERNLDDRSMVIIHTPDSRPASRSKAYSSFSLTTPTAGSGTPGIGVSGTPGIGVSATPKVYASTASPIAGYNAAHAKTTTMATTTVDPKRSAELLAVAQQQLARCATVPSKITDPAESVPNLTATPKMLPNKFDDHQRTPIPSPKPRKPSDKKTTGMTCGQAGKGAHMNDQRMTMQNYVQSQEPDMRKQHNAMQGNHLQGEGLPTSVPTVRQSAARQSPHSPGQYPVVKSLSSSRSLKDPNPMPPVVSTNLALHKFDQANAETYKKSSKSSKTRRSRSKREEQ